MNLPDPTPDQIMILANDVVINEASKFAHYEPYSFDAEKIAEAILAVDRQGRKL